MISRNMALALSNFESMSFEELSLLGDTLSYDILCQLDKHSLTRIIGRPINGNPLLGEALAKRVSAQLELLEQKGIGILTYWEKDYPPLLREIPDPPYILFYLGQLPSWERPSVGIVGTRMPTERGRQAAFKMGCDFALLGIPVVSGLALGIDAAAHRGVCRRSGTCIAVLAGGLDSVYPKSHRELAERILFTGGCLISEYPPGTPARKHRFPKRNRIISGISRGTVVVEAPQRSGALITALYALEQNRDVYVHSDGIRSSMGQGCRNLFEDGASVVLSTEDLLSQWGIAWDLDPTVYEEVEASRKWVELLEAELGMGGL